MKAHHICIFCLSLPLSLFFYCMHAMNSIHPQNPHTLFLSIDFNFRPCYDHDGQAVSHAQHPPHAPFFLPLPHFCNFLKPFQLLSHSNGGLCHPQIKFIAWGLAWFDLSWRRAPSLEKGHGAPRCASTSSSNFLRTLLPLKISRGNQYFSF